MIPIYTQNTGKLLFTLVILILTTKLTFAQGKITATLLDSLTNEPVAFANVVLKDNNDKTITGQVSDERGRFTFQNVAFGKYRLEAFYIGYASYKKNIELSPQNPSLELGAVQLKSTEMQLEDIVVEAKKELLEYSAAGVTVNADANISQQGGTVADILQNVPGVNIDNDGNVTIRGEAPNILIDGRNSALTGSGRGAVLDQIPASAVEQIEIVNNPSAKYDADAKGGILNIRLKKEKSKSFSTRAELGLGNRGRYNGALAFGKRGKKLNFFASYDGRRDTRIWDFRREAFNFEDFGTTYTLQDEASEREEFTHNLKAGLDFFINKNITIGAQGLYGYEEEEDSERQFTENYGLENTALDSVFFRQSTEREKNQVWEYTLTYTQKFSKKGQQLSAFFTSTARAEVERLNLSNQEYNLDFTQSNAPINFQRTSNDNQNQIGIFQIDYTHPISPKSSLETGYKVIIRSLDLDLTADTLINDTWTRNEVQSNIFKYDEQVHATYLIFKTSFGAKDEWQIEAGSRLEQVWAKARNDEESGNFDKTYFNIFPSVLLKYDLAKAEFLKLTYSKRITRPRFGELNPFIDIEDVINHRSGNPNLNPEIVHSFELGYNKSWQNFTLVPTLFYRHTKQLIQRIRTDLDRSNLPQVTPEFIASFPNSTIRFPVNLNTASSYGLELISTAQLTEWWDINWSFTLFRQQVDGNNTDEDLITENTTWNAKVNSNFNFWKNMTLQLSGRYDALNRFAQGERLPIYVVDLGLQQAFLDKKLILSLTISDIFNVQEFGFRSNNVTFRQAGRFKRDTRIFRLGLSYQIGKFDSRGSKPRG